MSATERRVSIERLFSTERHVSTDRLASTKPLVSMERHASMAPAEACGASRATPLRRARPLLGTLVEVGVLDGAEPAAPQAVAAAFDAIVSVQRCLSRFEAESDIARFNRMPAGASSTVNETTALVLRAAATLRDETRGRFDISLGSGPDAWQLVGRSLRKSSEEVRLDLGGIGKGHAVDAGIDALVAAGVASGWVNAGGDLRVFGDVEFPIDLRDEELGGVRRFATLADGAFATSHLLAGSFLGAREAQRDSRRSDGAATSRAASHDVDPRGTHVSVAAPLCLWADALTKVVALTGDPLDPLLARHGARAWVHGTANCPTRAPDRVGGGQRRSAVSASPR